MTCTILKKKRLAFKKPKADRSNKKADVQTSIAKGSNALLTSCQGHASCAHIKKGMWRCQGRALDCHGLRMIRDQKRLLEPTANLILFHKMYPRLSDSEFQVYGNIMFQVHSTRLSDATLAGLEIFFDVLTAFWISVMNDMPQQLLEVRLPRSCPD